MAFGGGGGGGGGGNDPVFNLSVVITVSLCAIGAAGIAYKCKKKYCDKHDYNKKDQDDGAAQVGNWEDFGEEPEGARVVIKPVIIKNFNVQKILWFCCLLETLAAARVSGPQQGDVQRFPCSSRFRRRRECPLPPLLRADQT